MNKIIIALTIVLFLLASFVGFAFWYTDYCDSNCNSFCSCEVLFEKTITVGLDNLEETVSEEINKLDALIPNETE